MSVKSFNLKSFTLDEEFVEKYKGKQPDWGPLGYFTYKRTYSRNIEGKERKEEFWETLRRVVEGCFSIQKDHCKRLMVPWEDDKAKRFAEEMYERMWNFKLLPPGRGLWIMGTEYIEKHGSAALNNCGFVSTKDIHLKQTKCFEFLMDSLMLGVGVGFDTRGAGKLRIKKPAEDQIKFQIPDSREGWVKALKLLLKSYFNGEPLPEFDFSNIRPAGAPIEGFGGVASGPKPLKDMLQKISKILENGIGSKLSVANIVDIMNQIGVCVVAGGVRRSAEIALGESSDETFITLKQNKEKLYSHRWISNNSVIAKIGDDYSFISKQIAKNGEPGIFWLENAQKYSRMIDPPDFNDKKALGINPCGEQTLESFELCCLADTFPSRHNSFKDFKRSLKLAYLYAKSVTLLNTHWEVTNAVMLKNRRIGISQTGIVEAFAKHGRRTMLNWSNKGYQYLKELDQEYSDWLCVPRSIKLTTVKPSGTVSFLPGVTHGIHYPHAEYYIRRIRVSRDSDILKAVIKAGYPVFQDKYSENTKVVEFPVHKTNFTRSKEQVTIWEQAENAADYQKYWSDNQVSITVSLREDEEQDIEHLLQCYEDRLKSISFLPLAEHKYEQAPYEKISKKKYKELKSDLKPLRLAEVRDREFGSLFCDSEECEIHIKKKAE
ncbi:MAG: fused protease/ribonucleoside-triphosphate reductase [Promethearchaeia archaeon]